MGRQIIVPLDVQEQKFSQVPSKIWEPSHSLENVKSQETLAETTRYSARAAGDARVGCKSTRRGKSFVMENIVSCRDGGWGLECCCELVCCSKAADFF